MTGPAVDLMAEAGALLKGDRALIESLFQAADAHWSGSKYFTRDPLNPTSGTVFFIDVDAVTWTRGIGGKGNHGPVVELLAARDRVSVQDTALKLLGRKPTNRPTINLTKVSGLADQSRLIAEHGGKAGTVYLKDNTLVRVGTFEGRCRVEVLDQFGVRHEAAAAVRFVKADLRAPTREREVAPPMDAIRDLMARPDLEAFFPVLRGVKTAPYFDDEGRLVNRSGYDKATGFFLDLGDLEGMEVPEPTAERIAWAVALVDELFQDFPLEGPADRAAVFALLVTLFCRVLISGAVPIFVVSAPAPGTGKTLLVKVIVFTAHGSDPALVGECSEPSEFQKSLLALLVTAPEVVAVDNLSSRIDSGFLAMIVTSGTWQGRLLGVSTMVSVKVLSTIILTANNPSLSNELARRSVPIRMVPASERPWQRTGFLHEDLAAWTLERRPDLVKAVLTLVRAWLEAGRPRPTVRPLGSFEHWTNVVGGVLEVAGVGGFLGNLEGFHGTVDVETGAWTVFLVSWAAEHDSRLTKVSDLVASALKAGIIDEGRTERATQTSLGRALSKMADRVFGGFRVVRGAVTNGLQFWKAVPIGQKEAPDIGDMRDIPLTFTRENGQEVTYMDAGNRSMKSPNSPTAPEVPEAFTAASSSAVGVY